MRASFLLLAVFAATKPNVVSTFVCTFRSSNTACNVWPWLEWAVMAYAGVRGTCMVPVCDRSSRWAASLCYPGTMSSPKVWWGTHLVLLLHPAAPWPLQTSHRRWMAVGRLHARPRMDSGNGALQKQLVLGLVDVMGERHLHAYSQWEHATKVASVTIMILQPPEQGVDVIKQIRVWNVDQNRRGMPSNMVWKEYCVKSCQRFLLCLIMYITRF